MARPTEPFFWSFFSSGGMISALVLPALAFGLWVARPLGWMDGPGFAALLGLVSAVWVRLALLLLIALCLLHWAHRFRYTLYDGLQLAHLYGLIAAVCYGGAAALTLWAAWVLWRLET